MESITRLNKPEALQKWRHLTDASLGFDMDRSIRCQRVLEAGGSPEALVLFIKETGHLTWPGTFGQSPWETASAIGYALWRHAQGETCAPDSLHADMLAHYQAAQAAMADMSTASAPTP